MTTIIQTPIWKTSHKIALAAVLAIQFAIAYFIGVDGLLVNSTASMIPPIALTVFIPVALFLATYALSTRFRSFVLEQDIRTLTMIQLWRVIGFVFLPLYAFGILPALFAWPAGVGDVTMGLAAVFVVAAINRNPDFIFSKNYLWFHLFGLADFVGALGTSALASGAFPGLVSNGLTSAAMDIWPLNIFPSFIVPAFIILQLTALLKVRHMRQQQSMSSNSAQVDPDDARAVS